MSGDSHVAIAKSVEQRVAELEQQLNANASQSNKIDGWKQYEHDLAEIQSLGLIERAQQDFGRRLTNVTVESWRIGYFKHTNTVWCDVWYRLPGGREALQQEFGYSRKADTNWSLVWGVEGKPR